MDIEDYAKLMELNLRASRLAQKYGNYRKSWPERRHTMLIYNLLTMLEHQDDEPGENRR